MTKTLTGQTIEQIMELAQRRIAELEKEQVNAPPQEKVMIHFDVEVHDLLSSIESNPRNSGRLLEIAAEKIRAGVPLQGQLGNFFADAFELAAAKPLHLQARALTDELWLTTATRRPVHSWVLVGEAFGRLVRNGVTQAEAMLATAAQFEINETTALTYYKKYMAAKKKHDADLP